MIITKRLSKFDDERGTTVLFDYPQHAPSIIYSTSKRGTLKGLHFQTNPWVRKEVFLLEGEIFDVCVSLGYNIGKYDSFLFQAPAHFEIPVGCAHGLLALTDTKLIYKFDPFWDIQSTHSLLWNDPELGINWDYHGINADEFIISTKDKNGLSLAEVEALGFVL